MERTLTIPDPDGIPLRCVMGRPGPVHLAEDLASLLELPAPAQEAFGEALEPNLAAVLDDRVETRVARFCQRHQITQQALAPSIKACRFLFTSAVKAGIARDDFVADVQALLPEAEAARVLERLLPVFDVLYPALRRAAVLQSIAEHGKVVRAVRWRLDLIKGSDHSLKLDVPVATITLQYQEGPTAGQATFQLLPEQAAELKRALEMIVD